MYFLIVSGKAFLKLFTCSHTDCKIGTHWAFSSWDINGRQSPAPAPHSLPLPSSPPTLRLRAIHPDSNRLSHSLRTTWRLREKLSPSHVFILSSSLQQKAQEIFQLHFQNLSKKYGRSASSLHQPLWRIFSRGRKETGGVPYGKLLTE